MLKTTRSLTVAAVVTALALPAFAASSSFQVTPANITSHPIGFKIGASPVDGTEKKTEYEVVLTRKKGMDPVRFAHSMGGGLVRVTQSASSFGFEGVRYAKKESVDKDTIRCRFTATPAEVSRLSFEIGFPEYITVKGKRQWMPSADFYYFHLRDFTPRK
jgi:hypothetical protein